MIISRRTRALEAGATHDRRSRADLGSVNARLRTSERTSPELPAGNVVPFAPRRASPAFILRADQDARPALTSTQAADRLRIIVVLILSLLTHATLLYLSHS